MIHKALYMNTVVKVKKVANTGIFIDWEIV